MGTTTKTETSKRNSPNVNSAPPQLRTGKVLHSAADIAQTYADYRQAAMGAMSRVVPLGRVIRDVQAHTEHKTRKDVAAYLEQVRQDMIARSGLTDAVAVTETFGEVVTPERIRYPFTFATKVEKKGLPLRISGGLTRAETEIRDEIIRAYREKTAAVNDRQKQKRKDESGPTGDGPADGPAATVQSSRAATLTASLEAIAAEYLETYKTASRDERGALVDALSKVWDLNAQAMRTHNSKK